MSLYELFNGYYFPEPETADEAKYCKYLQGSCVYAYEGGGLCSGCSYNEDEADRYIDDF